MKNPNLSENAMILAEVLLIAIFVLFGAFFGTFSAEFAFRMVIQSTQFEIWFWSVAFAWSAFLALNAFVLHGTWEKIHDPKTNIIGYGNKEMNWAVKIHQFVLNYLGALAGWVVMFLLLKTEVFGGLAGWEYFVLFAFMFLSITGYLPYILIKRFSFLKG